MNAIYFFAEKKQQKVCFLLYVCYNKTMKQTIHPVDTDVRFHTTFNKNGAQVFNPKIVYAGELKHSPQRQENWHDHSVCEIIFICTGTGLIHLKTETFPIKAGDIVIYNPHTAHFEEGNGLSLYFFGVKNIKLKNLPADCLIANHISPLIHTGNDADIFKFYFSQLISEGENKLHYYDEIAENIVKIILNMILRIKN